MTRRPRASRPLQPMTISSADLESVHELIDWAVDAAAYNKEMARELLANAKKLLRSAATPQ